MSSQRFLDKNNRQTDFPEAAKRHLEDAQTLANIGRGDNAAYLSGYSVECLCKTALKLTSADCWGHLPALVLTIHGSTCKYIDVTRLTALPQTDPIHGWKPDMRYDPDTIDAATGQRWVEAATRFYMDVKVKMKADLVLP